MHHEHLKAKGRGSFLPEPASSRLKQRIQGCCPPQRRVRGTCAPKPRLDPDRPPQGRLVIMASSTSCHGHLSQHKISLGPCTREKERIQSAHPCPQGCCHREAPSSTERQRANLLHNATGARLHSAHAETTLKGSRLVGPRGAMTRFTTWTPAVADMLAWKTFPSTG